MKRMKVGFIGCGVISEVYMESIRKNFSVLEMTACTDLDADRMNAAAERFGLKAMSYEEMLADPEIEMVINLTNPKAHYMLTKQALLSGKHVYSEKLIAITPEEAKELCEIAALKGLRLGCAPDTFLGGGIQTAKYALEKGLIGKPLTGVISMNRDYRCFGERLPHLISHGGSILYDMGGYYLTAFSCLLGSVEQVMAFGTRTEEVHHVRGVGSRYYGQDLPVEDVNLATALLKYRNGTLVTLHFNASTIINEAIHLELFGETGVLRLGDPNTFGGAVTLEKAHNEPVQLPFTHGFLEQSRGLGAAEMAWAILSGRPHRAGMEMASHVLEIVHGMLESIKNGQPYDMTTTFEIPAALPEGFLGNSDWEPTQESALV